jgi:two-component system, cell cycle response regulator CtrA
MKIIDVFICKLRKKLSIACHGEHYIQTVWGRGYTLLDPKEKMDLIATPAVSANLEAAISRH